MKLRQTSVSTLTLAICLLAYLIFSPVPAQAQILGWKPIDPARLALKAPVVEKDADAEALLWEVYINTASRSGTDFTHFVRVKIFTERGKETQSKIDIPYLSDVSVSDVAGRTIKPDGSIVERESLASGGSGSSCACAGAAAARSKHARAATCVTAALVFDSTRFTSTILAAPLNRTRGTTWISTAGARHLRRAADQPNNRSNGHTAREPRSLASSPSRQ